MGKLGDLWVHLGLKKNEYTAGLKQAEKEAKGFGGSVASVAGKAKVAFTVVAAAVAAVISAVKDLAKQNQVLGDAWNRMATGMAASWDTFKTAIATMDFTHLLSNMREANRLAKELYDARDAMGEIGSAYDISYGEQAAEINRLRIELQDVNKSDQERIAAGEKLLKIYEQLEKEPSRGLANVSAAEIDRVASKLGYNLKGASKEAIEATRREVKDFFVWLGTSEGEAYNAAAQKVAAQVGGIDSKLGQTFMRNAANNGRDRFAQLAIAYNKNINDKSRDQMAAAIRASGEQNAKFDAETRRIQTQINTLRGKSGGGASDGVELSEYEQKLALIREESAALREVREADEALARAEMEEYNAWHADYVKKQDVVQQSLSEVFGEDMAGWLEDGLQAGIAMGEELDDLKSKAEALEKALGEQLVSAIEDGLVGAFDALADVIGGVTDGGMEQVVKALLDPLADMAIKAGTLIMMSGSAIQALKDSFIGFFGGSAVVAGAALVAVGVAAKAGLAAIGNRGAGATSVSSYTGNSGTAIVSATPLTTELVVRVQGTVKGSDIILSGQNTLKDWNR